MNVCSRVIYLVGLLSILIAKSAIAQDTVKIANACDRIPDQVSLSTDNTKNTIKGNNSSDNSANSASDSTQTSFWWATEQFDPFGGKLVQQWLAHPQKQQINLVVNWQLWTLLDYLGRYRFVNQFGTVARKYGYSLNVFNQNERCLASYKYNFVSNPPKWELYLANLGKDSLQVEPQQLPQDENF
ncbi:hypothetical protein IQ255_24780 [Pleurocapsales cyanobacterium LEGE 10410]|nr:hypothetical protein [Pleurocapsales cyanobacterium LEGE 10410]